MIRVARNYHILRLKHTATGVAAMSDLDPSVRVRLCPVAINPSFALVQSTARSDPRQHKKQPNSRTLPDYSVSHLAVYMLKS